MVAPRKFPPFAKLYFTGNEVAEFTAPERDFFPATKTCRRGPWTLATRIFAAHPSVGPPIISISAFWRHPAADEGFTSVSRKAWKEGETIWARVGIKGELSRK